jgi:hypothetical protein
MRRSLAWMARALLCAGLSSCAPGYRLEAASGGTAERATASGFSLTASVDAWPGSSRQLVGEVLPVWIQIKNLSSTPVRVRYGDFGAVDEHGFWFGIVDPKTGRIIELPPASPTPPAAPAEHASLGASRRDAFALPVMVFDVESAWSDVHSPGLEKTNEDALACERTGVCAQVTLLPVWHDDTTSAEFEMVGHHPGIGARGFGGPPRSSYSGYYGGFGGYYGYGYPYYGYPGYGYPGYYGYYGWGWPYYSSGTYWPYAYYGYGRSPRGERLPTTAMMQHVALAEGELKPGASTAGFVYLPSAARRATQLDVTWAVHSTQGQPVTQVSARFVSVVDE